MQYRKHTNIIFCGIFFLLVHVGVFAQTTEFTFQGKLTDQTVSANGLYDLSFKLFDAANAQVGSAVVRNDVQITDGTFTVALDFGAAAFDGNTRTVEISVRSGASTGAFTTLSPKQTIASVPYAVLSKKATTADTATNATQLGGANASQFVQTNDTRMTDARNPLPNSSNYIQNTSIVQPNSNFAVAGNGTIGHDLTVIGAGVINTNFFIGNNLGIGGSLLVGPGMTGGYKAEIANISSNGLRVQTDTAGGNVASFGGYGEFKIDAPAVVGGRLRIKENGDFMINTETPSSQVRFEANADIRSASPAERTNIYPRFSLNFGGDVGANSHKWQIYTNGTSLNFSALNDAENAESVWMTVTRAGTTLGRVVFPNSVVALDVLGTSGGTALCINASNQIARCSSSIRYKDHVLDYRAGLDLVRKLRPVSFSWKSDGKADIGFVAEEVASIEPLLATRNEKGEVEGVKYDRITTALVNGMNEQQTQIDQQAKTIARLQQQIDALTKLACASNPKADVCSDKEVQR